MNRTQPREPIEPTEYLPSPSPHMPPAQVLREHCAAHDLQFIHIIGSRVCACPNGCVYTYPALKKLSEV